MNAFLVVNFRVCLPQMFLDIESESIMDGNIGLQIVCWTTRFTQFNRIKKS